MTPTLRAKALVNNKGEITSLVIAKPVSSRECDVDVCVVDARLFALLERAAEILRAEWDGGHKINKEIDSLRAEKEVKG